jgi:hypothetical protein
MQSVVNTFGSALKDGIDDLVELLDMLFDKVVDLAVEGLVTVGVRLK